ncbi:hypothetical protein FHJ31_04270 [Pseudomonas sp. Fig-3]|nr:hypothetical protein FHJ31_04270 [Pseudomonas sp. Fig-3]
MVLEGRANKAWRCATLGHSVTSWCAWKEHRTGFLWRGSLLPLGCEAALFFGSAAQPNGSKLPRHNGLYA